MGGGASAVVFVPRIRMDLPRSYCCYCFTCSLVGLHADWRAWWGGVFVCLDCRVRVVWCGAVGVRFGLEWVRGLLRSVCVSRDAQTTHAWHSPPPPPQYLTPPPPHPAGRPIVYNIENQNAKNLRRIQYNSKMLRQNPAC